MSISKADEAAAKYELERAAAHGEVVGHAALPWRVTEASEKKTREIVGADGSTVAKLTALDIQNAELIVRACNEHDALKRKMNGLVLLAELIKKLDDKDGLSSTALGYLRDKAIAALAAAGVQS